MENREEEKKLLPFDLKTSDFQMAENKAKE